MPEHEPDDQTASNARMNEDSSKFEHEHPSIPAALTAEQRRLLGKPRPVHERVEEEMEAADIERRLSSAVATDGPKSLPMRPNEQDARKGKIARTALAIVIIAALAASFYAGKKMDYWRYLWTTRNRPKLGEKIPDKYPGIPASELVEQALVSEHAGNWNDAAERFIAAKHKDLGYRGILFRMGKLAFDDGNFDAADRLLDRSIAFRENMDAANYLRGMIATRRGDYPAAERFFEAATAAEPFVADYYYYWAEALRLDHHPKDAIPRYEQAARRTRDDQDMRVCQFKVRMARLEAGQDEQLKAEIEQQRSTGPLVLDWLLTEAGVAIGDGRTDDAVQAVMAARAAIPKTENGGGLFLSCTGDVLFQNACKKHPLLADACDVKPTSP